MNPNQTESNALQTVSPARTTSDATAMMMDPGSMDKMVRFAEIMASGKSTIPVHLRGNPGDCLAVTMQAMSWGMIPHAVAQKTHIINGVLGYEAQLVAAAINSSGVVRDRFHFEWFGAWEKIIGKFEIKKGEKGEYRVPGWKLADEEGLGVRVWATLRGESEPRVLELLLAQARTRNSTLWADDPKQQLAYLGEKRWARLYAPDVILGVYSPDEFEQSASPRDMGLADEVSLWPSDLLAMGTAAAAKGAKAYGEFWRTGVTPEMRDKLVKTPEHEANKAAAIAADKGRTVESPLPATPPAQPAPAANPVLNFDDILKRVNDARNEDALYVAMDWANELTDTEQIKAIEDRFNARMKELRGEA